VLSVVKFKTATENLKTYKSHTTRVDQFPAEFIQTRCQIPNFVLLKTGKISWLIQLTASFSRVTPCRGI